MEEESGRKQGGGIMEEESCRSHGEGIMEESWEVEPPAALLLSQQAADNFLCVRLLLAMVPGHGHGRGPWPWPWPSAI